MASPQPDSEPAPETTDATPMPDTRIARYDEFFDPRSRSTVYRKTNKEKQSKHDQRLNKKKPVLVVRRVIDSKGRHAETLVDIRSHVLLDILMEITEGMDGLDLLRSRPECNPTLLFLCYKDLKCALQTEQSKNSPDAATIEALEATLYYIHTDFASTFLDMERLLTASEIPSITFDLLWVLFRPGEHVYNFHEYTEQERVLEVQSFSVVQTQEGPMASIKCKLITDDGRRFGVAEEQFGISSFKGAQEIHRLSVFPLTYHQDRDGVYNHAVQRGKRFAELKDQTYGEMSGFSVRPVANLDGSSSLRKFNTYGRVMIDPGAFRVFEPGSPLNARVYNTLNRRELTDMQYLICTPIVLGFSFGEKEWGGFPLDRLQDVMWSPEPFASLVIDPTHKRLIHALVKQHTSNPSNFDDFVQGKGKGLVGLLAGPPGCGKTFTAEAVAEATKSPLYCISSGELGTSASELDVSLARIFELAQRWHAVVLLDEADVFLSRRKESDVERNALVSIFLRQLEYYKGILFLTTNLISQFDMAFESRIHFTVHYPSLSYSSRKQIWEKFIAKTSGAGSLNDEDISVLAKEPLNGRQIKNTISTAQSLASDEGKSLSVENIRTVLAVMRDWSKARGDQVQVVEQAVVPRLESSASGVKPNGQAWHDASIQVRGGQTLVFIYVISISVAFIGYVLHLFSKSH